MNNRNKNLIVALLLAFAIGMSMSGRGVVTDRPFLRMIRNAAGLGLKLMLFAEPAPTPVYDRHAPDESYVDHSRSL
jgi:hypothetical protein